MSNVDGNSYKVWQPIIPSGNLRIYLKRTEPEFLVQYLPNKGKTCSVTFRYPDGINLPFITKITNGRETIENPIDKHCTHGLPCFKLVINEHLSDEELPKRGEIDIYWGGQRADMDIVDKHDKTHGHINMWTDGQLSYRRNPAVDGQIRGDVVYNSPLRQQFLLSAGYNACDSMDNLLIVRPLLQQFAPAR